MSVLELNGRVFDASTTGTLTLTGEGGAATTDVTQGLAKAWSNLNFSDGSTRDSFNTASIADVAVGRFTCSFTNSFANANYSSAGSSRFSAAADVSNRSVNYQPATGSANLNSFVCSSGAAADDTGVDSHFNGDLA